MRIALIVSSLALSSPARAESPPDPSYSSGDWIASLLAADAAGTLGAFAGAGLGLAIAGDCVESEHEDDGSFFGPCAFHGLGEAAIGGTLGATFGGAAGIYAYGELSGHDGNYWAAAGGVAVGLLATGGLIALTPDTGAGEAVRWAALFTLPALGGTLGYVLTLDDGSDRRPPSGALLEVDEGALRLGVPDLAVALDHDARVQRVDLRLMAGRF